jgi:hypothetical protein
MKHKLLILLMIAFSAQTWSQVGPVAVNDYAYAKAGDTITVNVLENDYHPEGLKFRISAATNCLSHTDSTITYYIDYDAYFSGYMLQDTLAALYILIDKNGFNGNDALGIVEILIEPHLCCNYIDINNVQAFVEPFGYQFDQHNGSATGSAKFEFPKDSKKSTLNSSALWIGGIDETGILHFAGDLYRNGDIWFVSGPLSVNGDILSRNDSTLYKWNKVWKLTKEEVEYHAFHYLESGYVPIEDIVTWPAHGDPALYQAEELAPYVDVDGDGHYDPMKGDYPLIRGDQCTYFVINDYSAGSIPYYPIGLGLECHVMAYAFYSNDSTALNNTIFMSYKVFNRSAHTYYDTYIGCFTYFSIGSLLDDFLGCDVSRSAYYGYNGDNYDEGGYGDNPPAQAVVLLGGPLMDNNGTDDLSGQCNESVNGVGFGDGIPDNERVGMSGFTSFNLNYFPDSVNNQGNPSGSPALYNYLKGEWKDSTAIKYGGNGSPATGSYGPDARFMYSGLSDPCFYGTGGVTPNGPVEWTESTAGNAPGIRMGVGSMGPFTFEPGTMERMDIAYVASFADPGETAVETLMHSVDEVRATYLQNPTYFGYQWLGMEQNQIDPQENKLVVYPNPVSNNLTFSYNGKDADANYTLTDMMGKIEMRGKLDHNESHTLDVSKLNAGIYILSITSKNGHSVAKVIKK